MGHHTHCFSGYEIYNGKHIFYSLGNFIFDYKKKYQKGLWTRGYAVVFKINDENIEFELIPYHQGRKDNPNLVLFDEKEMKRFKEIILELNNILQDEYFAWNGRNTLKAKEYPIKAFC